MKIDIKPANLYLYSNLSLESQKSLAGATKKPINIKTIREFDKPITFCQKPGAIIYIKAIATATIEVNVRIDDSYSSLLFE